MAVVVVNALKGLRVQPRRKRERKRAEIASCPPQYFIIKMKQFSRVSQSWSVLSDFPSRFSTLPLVSACVGGGDPLSQSLFRSQSPPRPICPHIHLQLYTTNRVRTTGEMTAPTTERERESEREREERERERGRERAVNHSH